MKKALIGYVLCFLFVAGYAASAFGEADAGQSAANALSIPARTEMPLPTSTPATDLNADFMNVVRTLLPDAQIINTEDYHVIAENGAVHFIHDMKTHLDEAAGAYEFQSKKKEAYAKMDPLVGTYAGARPDTDQAVLIRFMPVDCDNLKISAETNAEHWIEFDSTGCPRYSAYLWEHTVRCLAEFPQSFLMEQEKWYYCLMAVDQYGNFRFLMWEDGKAETQGYFAKKFNSDGDIIRHLSDGDRLTWQFTFRLTKNSILRVSQYWILDFMELAR